MTHVQKLDSLSPHTFESDLPKLVEQLQHYIFIYPEFKLHLSYESHGGWDNDSPEFILYGEREATTEEKEWRLKTEQEEKKRVLEFKRQQFEQLKKELGE